MNSPIAHYLSISNLLLFTLFLYTCTHTTRACIETRAPCTCAIPRHPISLKCKIKIVRYRQSSWFRRVPWKIQDWNRSYDVKLTGFAYLSTLVHRWRELWFPSRVKKHISCPRDQCIVYKHFTGAWLPGFDCYGTLSMKLNCNRYALLKHWDWIKNCWLTDHKKGTRRRKT